MNPNNAIQEAAVIIEQARVAVLIWANEAAALRAGWQSIRQPWR